MKFVLASMLMALLPIGTVSGGEPFACNTKAMTKTERAAYSKLKPDTPSRGRGDARASGRLRVPAAARLSA